MYPDGIYIGDAGTGEKRHSFDKCPGFYLRSPSDYSNSCTVDGTRTAFDISWDKHWLLTTGQSISSSGNIPPKLYKAIVLIESERRAREALSYQKSKSEMEASRLASAGVKRRISG